MRIIGGTFRNRVLVAPKGTSTRPTSSRLREAVFNICQNHIEGANFLDLFSGSGGIGIEALSRGASTATFVEVSRFAIHALRENIEAFHIEDRSVLLSGDVFSLLKILTKKQYDIIYADPPYETYSKGKDGLESFGVRIVKMCDTHNLLTDDGILFVEEGYDFSLEMGSLSTLECVDIRRNGRAFLLQFKKVARIDKIADVNP